MAEIDIDQSGKIDFDEYLKVMRRLREEEHLHLRALFRANEDASGQVDLKMLKYMILTLGYHPGLEQAEWLQREYSGKNASYEDCGDVIKTFRDEASLLFKEARGFSKAEVGVLRSAFDEQDEECAGGVGHDHMYGLLAGLVPGAVRDLGDMFDETILKFRTNSDLVTFQEFLQLARIVSDREDYKTHLRQREVVRQAGFNPGIVADVRTIFKLADKTCSHLLDFAELQEMLLKILPVTSDMASSLLERLTETDAHGNSTHMEAHGKLDFPEFLYLMRIMVDSGVCLPRGKLKRKRTSQQLRAMVRSAETVSYEAMCSAVH